MAQLNRFYLNVQLSLYLTKWQVFFLLVFMTQFNMQAQPLRLIALEQKEKANKFYLLFSISLGVSFVFEQHKLLSPISSSNVSCYKVFVRIFTTTFLYCGGKPLMNAAWLFQVSRWGGVIVEAVNVEGFPKCDNN